MFRTIHRLTVMSAVSLLGVLVGCKNDGDGEPKAPKESGNPFAAISKSRESNDKMLASNNLKQIMLAMHNFHAASGSFPGMIFDMKDGKPLLSWRVAILPYVEHETLYNRFKLDEPWDSPNNKPLLALMPSVFATPGVTKSGETDTHYRVFVSDPLAKSVYRAPFSMVGPTKGSRPLRIQDILDGTTYTIAVIEAAEAAPWTKPEGLEFDENKPLPKPANFWNGGFLVGMFDGSVRSSSGTFDEKEMRKAISYCDGQVVNFP